MTSGCGRQRHFSSLSLSAFPASGEPGAVSCGTQHQREGGGIWCPPSQSTRLSSPPPKSPSLCLSSSSAISMPLPSSSMNGMASSSSSSILKLIGASVILIFYPLSLLLFPPTLSPFLPSPYSSSSRLLLQSPLSSSSSSSCSSVLELPPERRCAFSLSRCGGGGGEGGLFNYAALHFCLLAGRPLLSLPALALLILLLFYSLVSAARDHFTPVVTRLAAHLRLSPSMAAVTLLALGNGAPDLFASVAAVRGGHPRTGLAAILSAGAFVSAFVVGAVAILAGPFPLDPGPFVRDVFFYFVAATALFYVYLSAEIFLWQAVGFILFYLFFVGFVFWMDLGVEGRKEKEVELETDSGAVGEEEAKKKKAFLDTAYTEAAGNVEEVESAWSLHRVFGKVWLLDRKLVP